MKNARKITSILIAGTISMVMLVGCGSKTTATDSNATNTTATTKNYSTVMKTTYSTVLKALVTDKTITQVQSDKVLAAVLKAMPTGGNRRVGGGKSDGQKPSGTNQGKQSGTREARTGNSKNNQLASLVTSKVITQVQANTINTKVQAAMKSTQGSK